jgi:hypothetical protein
MKSINQRLQTLAFFLIAPVLFIILRKSAKIYLPVILIGVLIAGCFRHYYEIDSQKPVSSEMISKMESSEKIYIAHFNDAIVLLNNLKTTATELEAGVQPLSENELSRAFANSNKSMRYKPSRDADILLQVHLYIDKDQQSFKLENTQKVIIPLASIARMDVYEKDKGRTTTNQIFSTLGVALLVTLGVLTIIACNCPQVSMQEGNQFEFKSGLYSGAVNSNLERSDYLLLDNFAPAKDSVQIRIDNVNGEQQFINRLQLLKVSHPAGTKVLADREGKIYSYATPVSPLAVIDNSGKDYSKQVKYHDSENAGFIQPGKDGEASSLVLQFPVNMAGKKARLILRANNTPWSGYMYKEFQGLYGSAYTSIRDSQEKMDASVSKNWIINQSLPLKVYVENVKGEWQMADYFQMPGNTAKRDMILELDIPNTPFQTVRIKLETVFRFWELDYAALDNTKQDGLESSWVSPSKALVSTGENALDKISATDKDYLSLTGHAYLDLQYSNLSVKNDTETYFLCGTGYYHQSPVNSKSPDVAALNKFKNPGYFQLFSLQEYEKVSTELSKNMYAGKNNRTRK